MNTTTLAPFVWDNDYNNPEQMRPYMEGFRAVLAEIEGAGEYRYNNSFRGRVPGLAGTPDEDTGIYLLQNLDHLDELAEKVDAFLSSGGRHVETMEGGLRGVVVFYGFYMGGTGWREFHDARLLSRDGRPYAVLPKGKRTNGHMVEGRVMIREVGR